MKHATTVALDKLEPLLAKLRQLPGLKERSRGIFYVKSRAFLHFHEDAAGLFADIRAADGGDFDRINVDAPEARAALYERARASLA
ncbi:MAG TPA: hypothetical protein VHZ26_00565 [Caulobacteraceae bacterium]|jgi:hypothetical protein|nr:hypothetical protein [Caulobacteraceae bacterium]